MHTSFMMSLQNVCNFTKHFPSSLKFKSSASYFSENFNPYTQNKNWAQHIQTKVVIDGSVPHNKTVTKPVQTFKLEERLEP